MPSVIARRMLHKLWQPRLLLDATGNADSRPTYAVMVLNRPVSLEKRLTISLWNDAAQRVLVDGGANRWLRFVDQRLTAEELAQLRPADMLTGDFDSVTDATRAKLAASGTQIIATPDQDHTDFTKALLQLRPNVLEQNISSIVTLVDSGGRIDHIMANINTMCKALDLLPAGTHVYAMCGESISWLLQPGDHCIEVPSDLVRAQRWCSYVPIGGTCTVTTTGFKWNLDSHPVQFGGMISTSNTYASERLTISTDGLLYWSMGIGAGEECTEEMECRS